jgi:NCAIR mutase (PurE)-related protein
MDRLEFVSDLARLDLDRQARSGIPEVVFGEGKTVERLVPICRRMALKRGRAIASRLGPGILAELQRQLGAELTVEGYADERLAVVARPGTTRPSGGGQIAVLAAGTSDIPVAEEARVMALEMGCAVIHHYDVGIAGLHRLVEPLQELVEADVAAIVAVAGMEGALPTLVKGLVAMPVIGVPTSVGYGLGRPGEAALLTMLSSCALGLTVVNVDNGIGGGATAALIANRLAAARVQGANPGRGTGRGANSGTGTGTDAGPDSGAGRPAPPSGGEG